MNSILDIAMDFFINGMRGLIFYWLLQEADTFRKSKEMPNWKKILILILPFVLVRVLIAQTDVLLWFFGKNQLMVMESKFSIISLSISFVVLLFCGMIVYARDKEMVFYLTLVFISISEISRFAVYSLTVWIPGAAHSVLNQKMYDLTLTIKEYHKITAIVEEGWSLLYFLLYLIGMAAAVKAYKKYLGSCSQRPARNEISFLMLPALTGLCIGCLIRSLIYYVHGNEILLMYEGNEQLYVLVPLAAVLCLLLLLWSVRVRGLLLLDQEEKGHLLIYQNRVEDMEQYIRDIEGMYEGIRGMKHDMKNYMADIQALLQLELNGEQSGQEPAKYREELISYLQGMEYAMEALEMRYKTGNPITDVVINRFLQRAAQANIRTDCDFLFPEQAGFDAFDISIILNNGLNNALEACEHVPAEDSWISVRARMRDQMLLLEIKNSMAGNACGALESGLGSTTKTDKKNHGFGLKNINNCVKKYYGHLEWRALDGVFCLTVMLQGVHL